MDARRGDSHGTPPASAVRRRRRRRLLAAPAGRASSAPASPGGSASALAADPSASPAAGKVVLRVGWTNDPDNLNPFIGAETSSYEIWLLNYDFLTGYSLDLAAHPRPRHLLGDVRRTARCGRSTCARASSGRTASRSRPADVAFTYNYIIDNQMGAYSSLTDGIDEAVAVDDLTVEIRCSRPKANMLAHLDPHPARARLEQGEPQGGRRLVPEQAADRRHRAVPDHRGQEGRLRAHGRQPRVLGQEAGHRRDPLRHLPEPGHDDPGPARGTLDAAWGIPSAQFPKVEVATGMQADRLQPAHLGPTWR